MANRPHRQDQARVTLTVDGRALPFVFSRREGGTVSSEESKSYPGGMAAQVAVGGPRTIENVTLAAQFVPQRDHDHIRWLQSRVGKGECTVSEQLLDVDGRAFGRPDTWTGVLMSTSTGTYDASSSEPRELELEISTDGVA